MSELKISEVLFSSAIVDNSNWQSKLTKFVNFSWCSLQSPKHKIQLRGVKSMINQENHIATNLRFLRNKHSMSQEAVAEKINVSRQAVAKWESGETLPDIMNCDCPYW